MTSAPIWKRALRALICYALDMGVAITGWTVGFGLEVKNWWALILLLCVARFFFHFLQMAFIHDDATRGEKPE